MVRGEKTPHPIVKVWQNFEKKESTPHFIRAICDPVDISNLPFVKYGRENEDKVADMYVKKMREEGDNGLRVAEVGLCQPILTSFRGISRSCCF